MKKKEKENENDSMNFSDIIKIEKSENDYIFKLKENKEISQNIDECDKFIDPSFDQVFKEIFSPTINSKEKSGNDRLLSLLNSLLFPNEEENKFIKVVPWGNESPIMNDKNFGCLKFDISCQATMKFKNDTRLVDVEMQLGKEADLKTRLFYYGSSLARDSKKKTIILGLINSGSSSKSFSSYEWGIYESDLLLQKKEKIEILDIIVINLKEQIKLIEEGKSVIVNGKELGKEGKNWLKLLGIRHFEQQYRDYYYLPKQINFEFEEIKSSFSLLKNYNEDKLRSYLNAENYANSLLNFTRSQGIEEGKKEGIEKGRKEGIEEGRKEGIEEGRKENILDVLTALFMKNEELFEGLIETVDKDNSSFKKEEIKKKFNETKKYNRFIDLLGKKRKLD